jgi:hypothetical protein
MEALGASWSVVGLAAALGQIIKSATQLYDFWSSAKEVPKSILWLILSFAVNVCLSRWCVFFLSCWTVDLIIFPQFRGEGFHRSLLLLPACNHHEGTRSWSQCIYHVKGRRHWLLPDGTSKHEKASSILKSSMNKSDSDSLEAGSFSLCILSRRQGSLMV